MEVASGEYGEEKVSKLINSIHNGHCEEIARRNAKLEEGSRTPSPPATSNNNTQGNGVIPTTPQDPEKQSLLECENFTNGKVVHYNGSLKGKKDQVRVPFLLVRKCFYYKSSEVLHRKMDH